MALILEIDLAVTILKYACLSLTVIMIIKVQTIIRKGYATVALCSQQETNIDKYERRIFQFKCIALFLASLVKILTNQYPLVLDLDAI